MTAMPERIGTPRLVLRCPTAADTAAVFRLGADARLTRHLAWPRFTRRAEADEFVTAMIDGWTADDDFGYLVEYEQAVVGMVSCQPDGDGDGDGDSDSKAAEIGFVIAPEYWRRGLASDAVAALVASNASRRLVDRLWAVSVVGNDPAIHVLERTGFVLDARWPDHAECPNLDAGRRFDVLVYAQAIAARREAETASGPSAC